MLNGEEERILSGIKYGLREELPKYREDVKRQNILKAIELDQTLGLGIFDKEEVAIIVENIKENYVNNNGEVKRLIKKNNRK